MSYLPSDNTAASSAFILDKSSASAVSSDITQHSETAFLSIRYSYFIDVRHSIVVNSSTAGLNIWRHWSTANKLGGTFRSNSISGLTMMTDESYCAANTPSVSMTRTSASSGTANITQDISFKSIWRIT